MSERVNRRERNRKGGRKIWTILLSCVLGAGAVAGIAAAVRRTTTSAVLVVPASSINYGGWFGNESSTSGTITTDAEQNIYVSDTETVDRVLVKEGQAVHKGDVLMIYDTETTALNLEKEELSRERIQLEIKAAQQNLQILNGIKPVSDGGYTDDSFTDGEFAEGDASSDEEENKNAAVYTELGQEAAAANENSESEELGTESDPYRFLCEGDTVTITEAFLEKWQRLAAQNGMERLYIALQNREEDGTLNKAWIADVCRLNADYPIVVDMSSGETAYAKMNDPAKLAQLLEETGEVLPARTLIKILSALDAEKLQEIMNSLEEEKKAEILRILSGTTDAGTKPAQEEEQDTGESGSSKETEKNTEDSSGGSSESGAPGENSAEGGSGAAGGNSTESGSGSGSKDDPEAVPTTATAPSGSEEDNADSDTYSGGAGSDSGTFLISKDAVYTSEELIQAKKEQQETLESRQLDLRESDLKIRQAQKAVEEGTVEAAMNGVIKTVGDPENPPSDGSAFLTLTSAEGLFVESGLRESLLGVIQVGDTVTVTSWQNGMSYEAEIRDISPYPDTSGNYSDGSGSDSYYPFTAYILEEDPELTSGEWVDVSMDTSSVQQSEEDDTLFLWKAFVREENGRKYVYLRGEDGRLHRQNIETGALTDSGYQILSGITSEDYVAFPYGKNVREGARTRVGTTDELYE